MMYLGDQAVGIAAKSKIVHGEFTPTEDLTEYTISPGYEINFLIVQKTTAERINNVRNFAYAIMFNNNNITIEYGLASNSTGTSWASPFWSSSHNTSLPIEKNGINYIVYPARVAGGAKFYAGETYEWYAI